MEAALVVAQEGEVASPRVPSPPGLAPYLNFARLSPTALTAIARVVDGDAEFRARVADAVDEETVGRPGWIWLARPEGWEDELAQLEDEDRAAQEAAREAQAERLATKRLAAAERATRRAEARVAERESELERIAAALADEQRRRAAAEALVHELEAAVDEARTARAEAVRALKEVEAQLVRRATEVNATKARVRELEEAAEERARATGGATGSPSPGEAAPPGAGEREAASPRPATVPGVDTARLAAELAAAAEGASELAQGLARLSRVLGGAPPVGGEAQGHPADGGAGGARTGGVPGTRGSDPGSATGDTAVGGRTAAGDAVGPPASRPPHGIRRPLTLPGGMFDDSAEAADHLLRAPGARLVVDGYNVSMAGWPDLPVAGQRERLVGALSELAARTATPVDVIFDGADVEPLSIPAAVRQLVHVRFSPRGVEADDVVIDIVAQLPPTQPVVVASSDNRVRAGARRQGANVVHARQLLAVAGRTGT